MDNITRQIKGFLLGEKLKKCEAEVKNSNYINLRYCAILGIFMMTFAISFGYFVRDILTFNSEFILMWIYFVIMYCVTFLLKPVTKHIIGIFYAFLVPLMILAILMGTFLDPTEPSITIMVYLGILPLFILDKPWRILSFIAVTAVLYTICCHISKSDVHFMEDMIDLVLFSVLAIGVNCVILNERITKVYYAVEMRRMAEKDTLTDIVNRRTGEEKIIDLLKSDDQGFLGIMDIDYFKQINDTYGHETGDLVLKTFSSSLVQVFREQDVFMRLGGDEFAFYISDITDRDAAEHIIQKIYSIVENLHIDKVNERITISLGAAMTYPNVNFDELYKLSDTALYQAKNNGKNCYEFAER